MSGKKMISIDIGSKNIRVIEGIYYEGRFDIEKAITIPTPPQCVKDGSIENKKILEDTLRRCLSENNIKTKRAVVTINSTTVINREIILPNVICEKLTNMVTYEMEKSVPVTTKGYVIEYKVIHTYNEKGHDKKRIRVAAMSEDIVNQYYDLLKGLKLDPLALDIHTNGVSKLFQREMTINGEQYNTDSTIAVIDLGYQSTNIQIISKGILDYSRLISYGGKDIDATLAGYYKVSPEEVDEIKASKLNLNHRGLGIGLEENIYHPIKEALTQWITEIQKVFQYHTSRLAENNVHKIYIHGGGMKINGVVEYMKQALGYESLYKLENIGCVTMNEGRRAIKCEDYINALGAMIRLK